LWWSGFFGKESAPFLQASDEWSFRDVGHHNGSVTRAKRGLAVIRFMSTVVLAARTIILWTIVNDVFKEMTYSAGIVVIFGMRAMRGVEASLFFIPESPFQCVLII